MEEEQFLQSPIKKPETISSKHFSDSEDSSSNHDDDHELRNLEPSFSKSCPEQLQPQDDSNPTSQEPDSIDSQMKNEKWDNAAVKTEPDENQEEGNDPSSSSSSWKEPDQADYFSFIQTLKVKSEAWEQTAKLGEFGGSVKVEDEYINCPECSKRIKPRYMKVHLGKGNCNPSLTCEECNKTFSSFQKLKKHKKIHTGNRENKHLCNFCPKTFYESYNLKVHTRTHTGEKPFQCEFCAKTFTERGQLKMHTYVHSGLRERTYVCDLCPKTFYKTTNLFAHKRTHSGEKPFSCEYCGRLFSEMGNMKKHVEKFHNKMNPSETDDTAMEDQSIDNYKQFPCGYCGALFFEKENMKKHLENVHNKMDESEIHNTPTNQVTRSPHPETDQNSFSEMGNMKKFEENNEMNVSEADHNGEKTFACGYCGKLFSEMVYMKNHVENFHNNIERCQTDDNNQVTVGPGLDHE